METVLGNHYGHPPACASPTSKDSSKDTMKGTVYGIFLLSTSFAVHRQDTRAAFAGTPAIVFEVKHDRVLAGRERRRALPSEADVGMRRSGCSQKPES